MENVTKLIEEHELPVDSYTGCFLLDKDELLALCKEYVALQQPPVSNCYMVDCLIHD